MKRSATRSILRTTALTVLLGGAAAGLTGCGPSGPMQAGMGVPQGAHVTGGSSNVTNTQGWSAGISK